jgi:hypothetical protein
MFSGKIRRDTGIDIISDDLVTITYQAPCHIGAHLPQTYHCKFHMNSLAIN